MLCHEMLLPLGIFALLDSGCTKVYRTERAVVGIEKSDSEEEVELFKEFAKPTRRFSYGPHQDRNQHQMSGRVR